MSDKMKTIQPRKQRKMLYNAPAHVRYAHFSSPLSPSLKTARKVNSVPVRTGDTVRIMRGERKGSEGKITRVDRRKYRIFIEGITREKVDGTAIPFPIHPSKVMITNLNMDDKWRSQALKVEAPKEAEKPTKEEKKPQRKRRKAQPRKTTTKTEAPRKRKARQPKIEKKEETEIG